MRIQTLIIFLFSILFAISCDSIIGSNDRGDQSPPEVVSVVPEDEAEDVDPSTVLKVNFNEELDDSNFLFEVQNSSNTSLEGTISVSGNEMSFKLSDSLEHASLYKAHVKATDLSGNTMENVYSWEFSTAGYLDPDLPKIVSSNPEEDSDSVDLDQVIEITFDKDISDFNFSLVDEEGNEVEGESWLEYNDEIVFEPDNPFISGVSYTASVKIFDSEGNEADYQLNFTARPWALPDLDDKYYEASDAVSDESYVYVNGTFRENGFTRFFIAKFDHSGKQEKIIELEGKTDSDFIPSLTINKEMNELYFFTDYDRTIYFNRMDTETNEVYKKSISGIENIDEIKENIVIDNNNNLYFFFSYDIGQFLTGTILRKINRDGNKINEFDFERSSPSSLTTDGSNLFFEVTYDSHRTIGKMKTESLELEGFFSPDSSEVFPEEIRSVQAHKNSDKLYIVGVYEDRPILFTFDQVTSEGKYIQFGDIYDSIYYHSPVDDRGNVYVLTVRPDGENLFKVSESGIHWKKDAYSVDKTKVLEEANLIFLRSTLNDKFHVISMDTGEMMN